MQCNIVSCWRYQAAEAAQKIQPPGQKARETGRLVRGKAEATDIGPTMPNTATTTTLPPVRRLTGATPHNGTQPSSLRSQLLGS